MSDSAAAAEAAITEAIAARVLGSSRALNLLPYYVGAYLDSLMMGLMISQLFTYCRYIQTDKKHVVAAVFAVAVLTTTASMVILLWIVDLYVWNFGRFTPFTEIKWLLRYTPVEIATIAVVQAFYVDRCCRLYRHWWPAALMGPAVIITAILGSLLTHYMGSTYTNFTLEMPADPKLKHLAYSWMGFILATDTVITVTIAYGLWRIKTGWEHTDNVLKRLVIRCFETQTPALLSSAISLLLWARMFEVVLGFLMLQSKVFALSLIITLNLRTGSTTSENNVTFPSGGAISSAKYESNYPMDSSSSHQEQPPKLNKSMWRPSTTFAKSEHVDSAIPAGRQDDAYGSTVALHVRQGAAD